jgi:curved DNA-binding protein CbpA
VATDYYAVLGIERSASESDIKAAYRGLARKYHPDVAEDKSAAETRFKEINEAYEVLGDPQKRQQYDRYGAVPNGAGGGAGAGGFSGFGGAEGFSDIFDMFFGGGSAGQQQQRRPSGPARGADLRYDLQITLEEAYRGVEREIGREAGHARLALRSVPGLGRHAQRAADAARPIRVADDVCALRRRRYDHPDALRDVSRSRPRRAHAYAHGEDPRRRRRRQSHSRRG